MWEIIFAMCVCTKDIISEYSQTHTCLLSWKKEEREEGDRERRVSLAKDFLCV